MLIFLSELNSFKGFFTMSDLILLSLVYYILNVAKMYSDMLFSEYSHRYHQYGHQKLKSGVGYNGPPLGAPPLPPHQHHHHPSHAHAHTHPPLHDENGVITNDPNDESATSDLATSYLAHRYIFKWYLSGDFSQG